MDLRRFRWNWLNPSRQIFRLEHNAGISTIEVRTLPGLAVSALLIYSIYVFFVASLGAWRAIYLEIFHDFSWHQLFTALPAILFLMIFSLSPLAIAMMFRELVMVNEILRLNEQTAEYVSNSWSTSSRIGTINSLVNVQVRGQMANHFFHERYGIVGQLAGAYLAFGAGLSKQDAERILSFILENHPNIC